MSNKVIWTPSQRMASLENHSVEISGTINDENGDVRSVDFNNWGFQTADEADVLFESNFQQFTADTPFTVADLKPAFNWYGGPGAGFGDGGRQWAYWRNDPEGKRGVVCSYELEPNNYGGGGSKIDQDIDWSVNHDLRNAAGEDEIWVSFDLYLSPGHNTTVSTKLPGPESFQMPGHVAGQPPKGLWCAAAPGLCGNASDGFLNATGPVHPSSGYRPYNYRYSDKNNLQAYYHGMRDERRGEDDGTYYRRTREYNMVRPTIRVSGAPDEQWTTPTGEWVNITTNYKMNTLPGNGLTYEQLENQGHKNGYARFYANGQLMWDTGNIIWRNEDKVKWNNVRMHHFYGGSTNQFNSPYQPQFILLDRVVISTQPLLAFVIK